MKNTEFDGYLKAIGKSIGLELEFDDDNVCQIAFNDDDTVFIEANPEDGNLMLSSMVALDLPDPVSYSLIIDLMDLAIGPFLNRGGNSPVIGRDPDSGALIIYQVCTKSVLESSEKISDIFTQFIQFKMAFSKHIEENTKSSDVDNDAVFA